MKLWKVILIDLFLIISLTAVDYCITYIFPQKLKSSNIVISEPTDMYNVYNNDGKTKFANKFTDEVVSTATSYSSPDISMNIKKNVKGLGIDKITYFVVDVYIDDIRCLQSKFANNVYGTGYSDMLLNMDLDTSALFAINGDSYSSNRKNNNGTIIRNGVIYRSNETTSDMCVLYYDGTMKTYSQGDFDVNQAIKDGAYQSWLFGPNLLDQKGKALSTFNTSDYIKNAHPRTAIGYYEPGHYCFVLVDGRNSGYSRGMYLQELSKVFENLGCKVAYNLDGGYSSTMTFNDSIVNKPYINNRPVSDCILIKEVN